MSGERFSAKTIWLGNPAGSIAPVGRAAIGIPTLWKFGSLEAWKFGIRGGALPHAPTSFLNRQGAKRRTAVAVSGEAAERPMEPEAVRASPCVFAVPFPPGQY